MEWIPWTISAAGVGTAIIAAMVTNTRKNRTALHKRIDTTRDDCKDSYANKEVFEDFRTETRENFRALHTKVDGIPQAVKNLLNGGN